MNGAGEVFEKTLLKPFGSGELENPVLQLVRRSLVKQKLDKRVPLVKGGQGYFPSSLLMPTPLRIAPESVVTRPG